MPRDGSGNFSKPAGTTAVSSTTIDSSKFNELADDIVADLNAARPVSAGGTGASSPSAARQALGLEIGTDVLGFNAALNDFATTGQIGTAELEPLSVTYEKMSDTALTGDATTLVTGVAGNDGAVLRWDANGDAIGGPSFGSGPNQLLRLEADGKIPAVDGSQLTNIGWNFAPVQVPVGGETEFDFTIPAGVNEVFVSARDVLPNGSGRPTIRFGEAGGIVASGYYGSTGAYFGNATNGNALSASFIVRTFSAAQLTHFSYSFRRISAFEWAGGGTHGRASGGDNGTLSGGVALSAELTTVRVLSTDSTFAAGGQISVGWRI